MVMNASNFAVYKSVKRVHKLACKNYCRVNVSARKRAANRTYRHAFKQAINTGAVEAVSDFNPPSRRCFLTAWDII